MTAKELVAPIERFAPPVTQEGWDNCGFLVGDSNREVKRAILALDCTEDVIDEAIEGGFDIIITHHPLIFGGLKNIAPDNFIGRIIEKAIKNDIAIYSAHTNMDKAIEGVSSLMAQKLGLKTTELLTAEGFGVIGELQTPMSAFEFVKMVKERFGLLNLMCSKPVDGEIKKVAVCGGSGKSFIKDAMRGGAQIYITGDVTYHDYYCEKGFMVMDIGHYKSEYDIVELFSKILCENFPNFAVSISKKNNNPIYYY